MRVCAIIFESRKFTLMNYITAEGLTKVYGDKVLFEKVTISVNRGQKVAIVAKNGTGKSTLLRIVVGEDRSDIGGSVSIHRDARMGYLSQEPDFDPNSTVWEAVFASDHPGLVAIRAYEKAMTEQELYPSEENQTRLAKAMEKVGELDAWDQEAKVKEVLGKFKITQLDQKMGELSGGERKRVAMASVLIQEPDLLVLDEPTNHLDLPMIEWLEEQLNQPNLTILLVTHDRYFLDRVCDEIVEIERGNTYVYRGNYSYYLEKKSELTETRKAENEKFKKLMSKELQWIRTQPKARGTKAKSRVSNFDKIKEKASEKFDDQELGFEGIKMARIGKTTVEMHYIDHAFGEKKLFSEFNYTFKRRERVGIVGANGSGKSTFLKILTGALKPDAGKVVIGGTVVFGHYQQDGLDDYGNKKVIDVIREIAEVLPVEGGRHLKADQLLNHFMFPYEQHENYVHTLSGGEKRRLYLLTILMQNPNFLILDEPTNDLDLLTLNMLEAFLLKFNGCLVVVSHDRYFMDKLVNHVFVLDGKGKVRDYPGNYTQYREKRNEEEAAERAIRQTEKAEQQRLAELEAAKAPKKQKEKKKLSYKEQQEFNSLEGEIEVLETQKEELEAKIATGGSNQELMDWSMEISKVLTALEEKENRWLELSEYA